MLHQNVVSYLTDAQEAMANKPLNQRFKLPTLQELDKASSNTASIMAKYWFDNNCLIRGNIWHLTAYYS